MILPQEFYFRDTTEVAKDLLGKVLYRTKPDGETVAHRIVETEAYIGIEDAASHAFGDRRTARTEFMYLPGGHSYVYLIYGMYNCLNVVTGEAEEPKAVLIRAVEPLHVPEDKPSKKHLLTNGPGKLCRDLSITKADNGLKLWKKRSGLWLEEDGYQLKPSKLIKRPRVGVDYAGEAAAWPLRFYIKDSLWVSRP